MKTTPVEKITDYRARGWWSDTRITDIFDSAVAEYPDREALLDPPNRADLVSGTPLRLSFKQIDELARRYAQGFCQHGLRRDDVLITQLPNIAEYIPVYIAAMRLGIIVSPVAMQFRRHELEGILKLTGAKHILTVAQFRGANHAETLVPLQADLGVQILCLLGSPPEGSLPFATPELTPEECAELHTHIESLQISADDIATICWTSGTEGIPKGVPRSHNQWIAISHAHFIGAKIQPGEKLLNPFPFVNMAAIGGCFLSWLHARGTLIMHHPFEPAVYLRQIATEQVEYAIAPPAILNMLIKDEKLLAQVKLDSLRCIGSGSAPLDPSMIRGFHDRFGIEVVNIFGSNEGVSLLSNADNLPDPEQRARLFPRYGRTDTDWGAPSPSKIQTRIVDPDTQTEILEAGRAGEMQITGPTVFDGYLHAPHINAESFTADGWFRTGDLFDLHGEEGQLRFYRFVGRLKQVINRGGIKIAPEELDTVLAQMPAVAECAVTAYKDDILGERICAVVVPRAGATLTLEDIRQHFLDSGVAIFKHPERLRLMTQLPRNSTGKVIRSEINALAATEAS